MNSFSAPVLPFVCLGLGAPCGCALWFDVSALCSTELRADYPVFFLISLEAVPSLRTMSDALTR